MEASVGSVRLVLRMQRFEIADIILSDPRLVVRRGADGLSNWEPLIERLEGQLRAEAGDPGAALCFQRALALTEVTAERELLQRRLAALHAP